MDAPPFNPYQAPAAELDGTPEADSEEALLPLPFEDPERYPGFWSRVGGMFSLLFRAPLDLFRRVEAGDGFGRPVAWSLFLSIPILALVCVLMFVIVAFATLTTAARNNPDRWIPVVMAAGYPLLFLASQVAGVFLGGLLTHASLWAWGGLRPGAGIRHTIRAQGYFLGFFILAYMIPLLNVLVLLGAPAFLGMGLARLHRTDTWRGVCAAYTPLLLCCVLYIGFLALAMGAAAFGRR